MAASLLSPKRWSQWAPLGRRSPSTGRRCFGISTSGTSPSWSGASFSGSQPGTTQGHGARGLPNPRDMSSRCSPLQPRRFDVRAPSGSGRVIRILIRRDVAGQRFGHHSACPPRRLVCAGRRTPLGSTKFLEITVGRSLHSQPAYFSPERPLPLTNVAPLEGRRKLFGEREHQIRGIVYMVGHDRDNDPFPRQDNESRRVTTMVRSSVADRLTRPTPGAVLVLVEHPEPIDTVPEIGHSQQRLLRDKLAAEE